MERGLSRRLSGITFSRNEIEKSVTVRRKPSDFWRLNPNEDANIKSKGVSGFAIKKPCRDDIKITGSVLKKPVK